MENLHLACELAFYKAALKMALEKLQKYDNVVSIIYQWKPDTVYEKGDCARWHDIDFICTKEHRSKKEFSDKYWRV